MQMLLARWQHRRNPPKSNTFERPSFYFPAKPEDVVGITTNPNGRGVDEFVPIGFESYVWLPNPAWKWVDPEHKGAISFAPYDNQRDLWAIPVSWSEIARANGKQMDKHAIWREICGRSTDEGRRAVSPEQNWTWAPSEQNIEPFVVPSLAKVLSRWTSPNTRCLSGKWEGGGSDWESEVRLAFSHWTYCVWSCRFDELVEWLKQPNSFERDIHLPHVIWPEDRSWFLAILYSGWWSYLGGSRELVDLIVESDEIEGYEVKISDHAR